MGTVIRYRCSALLRMLLNQSVLGAKANVLRLKPPCTTTVLTALPRLSLSYKDKERFEYNGYINAERVSSIPIAVIRRLIDF